MEGTTKKEASSELIVQELAGVVPAHYVMPPQDRPSAVAAAAPIPVIDLGRLSGPNADGQEAAKLRLALETWGFLKVSNHGIETSVMDAMMNVSREFFGKPAEEKQKYTSLLNGERNLQGCTN